VDPVALIVTALAAGAGAAVQDEAPDAIKDAYAQLQDGVRRRLALFPDAELVLAQHGADPQAGHVLLASKLAKAGAGNDAGLTAAAVALMELVDAAGTQAG
jgi:carbamate kinase